MYIQTLVVVNYVESMQAGAASKRNQATNEIA